MFQGAVFVVNTKWSCLYHQYFCSPTDKLHNHIFLPTITQYHIPTKYALDHEGRAVGVAASPLQQIVSDDRNPFGGLPRRDKNTHFLAMTYWETNYKQFISTTSAEVSNRKIGKPITNGSSTTSGVARCCHAATSERGCGWVGCLPYDIMPEVKRASTRSHSWQFLGRTPYIICFSSAPVFVVGARPVLGACLNFCIAAASQRHLVGFWPLNA